MSRSDAKYLVSLQARYAKASKKERGKILDEYVAATGCHRKYAIGVLSGQCQRVTRPIRRPRCAVYTAEDGRAIRVPADLFDDVCSKRLRVAMDTELDGLCKTGLLHVSRVLRTLKVSPATMDRLRARQGRSGSKTRGSTKPGVLLKQQIPIRTWADWSEDRPGFCEMDHAWTLDFTDVKTQWTECVAVPNKAQKHVFAAIQRPTAGKANAAAPVEWLQRRAFEPCWAQRRTRSTGF